MKCQILFSGKNKKNINLSSAEFVQRVVKVYISDYIDKGMLFNNQYKAFFRGD